MSITRHGVTDRAPHSQRYPWQHKKLRKLIKDQMAQGISFRCGRCRLPIEAGQPWHLDHSDDRAGYIGPSHARCNTSAGARKGMGYDN